MGFGRNNAHIFYWTKNAHLADLRFKPHCMVWCRLQHKVIPYDGLLSDLIGCLRMPCKALTRPRDHLILKPVWWAWSGWTLAVFLLRAYYRLPTGEFAHQEMEKQCLRTGKNPKQCNQPNNHTTTNQIRFCLSCICQTWLSLLFFWFQLQSLPMGFA